MKVKKTIVQSFAILPKTHFSRYLLLIIWPTFFSLTLISFYFSHPTLFFLTYISLSLFISIVLFFSFILSLSYLFLYLCLSLFVSVSLLSHTSDSLLSFVIILFVFLSNLFFNLSFLQSTLYFLSPSLFLFFYHSLSLSFLSPSLFLFFVNLAVLSFSNLIHTFLKFFFLSLSSPLSLSLSPSVPLSLSLSIASFSFSPLSLFSHSHFFLPSHTFLSPLGEIYSQYKMLPLISRNFCMHGYYKSWLLNCCKRALYSSLLLYVRLRVRGKGRAFSLENLANFRLKLRAFLGRVSLKNH